jgi:hypothetical protein
VLERHIVHALGLAQIAAPRVETTEPEVRLLAGGIEREGLGVATDRKVVVVGRLVCAGNLDELERARG